MPTLSIVIPAYNEEGGIVEIARRVLSLAPQLNEAGIQGLELLVVDDGSSDRTADMALSVDGVRLIRHGQNRGYGAALKSGFQAAGGELIGFLDADGTYPPECSAGARFAIPPPACASSVGKSWSESIPCQMV